MENHGELTPFDTNFLENIYDLVLRYCEELEELRIKNALKTAVEVATLGNKFFQDTEFWTLEKKDPERFKTVISIATNLLRLVALLIEPFMPSLAAKVYVQLGLVRDSREETLLKELVEANSYKSILSLLKPGTVVVNPLPIFKVISLEQTNALKVKYAGKNN